MNVLGVNGEHAVKLNIMVQIGSKTVCFSLLTYGSVMVLKMDSFCHKLQTSLH